MISALFQHPTLLAAAEEVGVLREYQVDFPQETWKLVLYGAGFVLAFAAIIFTYIRDTRELSVIWKIWLTLLRFSVLVGLLAIALNPHERTSHDSFRPSRVAFFLDNSTSMSFPERQPPPGISADSADSADFKRTRAEAVRVLLENSPLISELTKRHEVSIFSFPVEDANGRAVSKVLYQFPAKIDLITGEPLNAEQLKAQAEKQKTATPPNWEELLNPVVTETRMSDAVRDLVDDLASPTLSGIVVIGDGGNNAGSGPEEASKAAKARTPRVRLIAVGVGSTERQANIRIANVQAPTNAHINDPYEIRAFVQGSGGKKGGLQSRRVDIELLAKPADEKDIEPILLESQQVTLPADGVPVEVKFEQKPTVPGKIEFTVRAVPISGLRELRADDNEDTHTVNVTDRKTRVLIMAGGPMRDFRFVRNMLFRHEGIESDVWLQTVGAKEVGQVSQEAQNVLVAFPESEEQLFEYDVILAFDPDWTQVPPEGVGMINRWIEEFGGGMVLIAGESYTGELARADETYDAVREFYPVFLQDRRGFQIGQQDKYQQAWPVAFTEAGRNAAFLNLVDDAIQSAAIWKEFPGIYRTYPTAGPRAGATIYAHSSDFREVGDRGPSILLASQLYGSGRTMYVGSAEWWRLRSEDEEHYDRLWTKLVREAGQGRLKSGGQRAVLMPEKESYYLGETVRVRARVLDQQFQPLEADSVTLDVTDPNGRSVFPAPKLMRDKARSGEFLGSFRASGDGKYELRLPDQQAEMQSIRVTLPNLEADRPEQNADALQMLQEGTGGRYMSLGVAEKELAKLLPNSGVKFTVDERLKTLWDRAWLLYLLVGLLSVEWLTRKLLKLA
jgi:hypothetical protein